MSAPHRASLQRFIFGEPVFSEHEGVYAFQHRFLISIALAAIGFNLIMFGLFAFTSADADFFPFVSICWIVGMAGHTLLWRWLRAHPHQRRLGSLLIAIWYWLNVCVPGSALPPDPLLPMWTILLIVGVFMMVGRAWGWVALVVAVASSHFLLKRVDLAPFPHALSTVWLVSLASAVLGHIYVARFDYLFTRLDYYNERLRWLSAHDGLTGALNASAFYEQCNSRLALCRRQHLAYAVLFVDLDHFKQLNDRYGHAKGDEVLVRVAQAVRDCLREYDLLGRVGGEEFSIFLTGTALDGGRAVAERIRANIEAQRVPFHGGHIRVTASIGITGSCCSVRPLTSIHDIQPLADKAMYEAKLAGRNQVAVFGA